MHGNEEKNKAAEVGGPLCRISCQLRRPHIQPLLSQSLVPSVKLHLLDLDVLLFVPSHRLASPRPPPWLQSEFQPSAIKYASPSACGAFTISNQKMPPTPFLPERQKAERNRKKLKADGREIECNGFQRVPLKLHTNTHLSLSGAENEETPLLPHYLHTQPPICTSGIFRLDFTWPLWNTFAAEVTGSAHSWTFDFARHGFPVFQSCCNNA